MVAQAASPLALIVLGMGLAEYGVRTGWRISVVICFLKLIVQPLVVWLLARLIGRDGETGRLLFARGEACRLRGGEGDLARAIADLEKAATLADAPAAAHRSLGLCLQNAGLRGRAAEAYRRYLDLAPNGPDVEMIRTYIKGLQSS